MNTLLQISEEELKNGVCIESLGVLPKVEKQQETNPLFELFKNVPEKYIREFIQYYQRDDRDYSTIM